MYPGYYSRVVRQLYELDLVRTVGPALQAVDMGKKMKCYEIPLYYIHENFLMDKSVDIALKGIYFSVLVSMDENGYISRSVLNKLIGYQGFDPKECIAKLLKFGLLRKERRKRIYSMLKRDEMIYMKDTSVEIEALYDSLLLGLSKAVVYRDIIRESYAYIKVNYYYRLKWKLNSSTDVYERSIFKFFIHINNSKEVCEVSYANLNSDTNKDENWVDDFFELYPNVESKYFKKQFNSIIESHKSKLLMSERDIEHEKFYLT
jgi:hypothetical protein